MFDRVGTSTDILSCLNILIDGIQYRLSYPTDPRMSVIKGLPEKLHIVGIEMQGIDERKRFVVQCMDISAERRGGPADSRAPR